MPSAGKRPLTGQTGWKPRKGGCYTATTVAARLAARIAPRSKATAKKRQQKEDCAFATFMMHCS